MRQPGPDLGLGLQVQALNTFEVVPSPLDIGLCCLEKPRKALRGGILKVNG